MHVGMEETGTRGGGRNVGSPHGRDSFSVEALGFEPSRSRTSGLPSIHSKREHIAGGCVPVEPRARENPFPPWFRRPPERRAASSRNPSSMVTERRRVSITS